MSARGRKIWEGKDEGRRGLGEGRDGGGVSTVGGEARGGGVGVEREGGREEWSGL